MYATKENISISQKPLSNTVSRARQVSNAHVAFRPAATQIKNPYQAKVKFLRQDLSSFISSHLMETEVSFLTRNIVCLCPALETTLLQLHAPQDPYKGAEAAT